MNHLSLLEVCLQKIRNQILPLIGSTEAGIEFGTGAGGDIIKKIDLVAENAIIQTLENYDVSCTLISEETGTKKIGPKPSEFYVTADPIDGTTNALRGLPFIATSIATSETPHLHEVETALVSDIFHNITYTAKRHQGAFRNEKKIKPSLITSLEKAVVGVDFNTVRFEKLATRLMPVLQKSRHLRHLGANALELCYVADGTTDAFIDLRGKLRVTDIAAAYLILLEAGGIMVTPEGTELNAPLDAVQRVSFIATSNMPLCEIIRENLAER